MGCFKKFEIIVVKKLKIEDYAESKTQTLSNEKR